jgi:RNA polymerase sigma factor (sigma-70 family)
VLQEVWISAFRRRRSFREDSTEAFDRWLTTLVDRKLLDTIRLAQTLKRGGREAVIQDAIRSESNQRAQLADVASPVRTPSRIMSSKEAAWAVKLALEALPDDYRVAIRMHVMDGRSYAEVAEALRLPATAVRYLLRDGLRQLQRRLGSATKFFTDAGKSRQART